MAYDDITNRTSAASLIPEVYASGIIKDMTEKSAALTLFRRLMMSTAQTRMSVLSALPNAYFVSGDTGLKQTTEVAWANKFIDAEELAVIVPVPENVIDDAAYPIWDEVIPLVVEAFGRAIDGAIFFDINAPASWPTGIAAAAEAAGNLIVRGTATQATGGIAKDISDVMATVEADGFDVNGFVTSRSFRKYLRNARATDGQKLMDVSTNQLDGEPVVYTMSGLFPSGVSQPELFAGDWSQFMLGMRKDISWRVFTEGVIQDGSGNIVYNLMQQDMVALRFVMRLGWQVANPKTYSQPTEADRYPVAFLKGAAS